ncbi:MAG: hypothetical protein CL763_03055 [Chloroflexi bacterium]|nr:hypothetical protein [Chloroflexota bacterium]|tara:strand:- start:1395 stop:1826 length:432 start_codon:yes stop_codon:yes gene_type:complete
MATNYETYESNGLVKDENDVEYSFDPALIEQQGQSLNVVLESRLCDAGLAKFNSFDEKPTYKALRKIFRDQCANTEDFLSPQHPILESVVRLLLSSKADSMKLDEIHTKISALWLTSTWPRHMSKESMRKVLNNAKSYGISKV